MARKVIVEFKYVDKDSCSRCRKTAENVENACFKLMKNGLAVVFKARKLPLSKLPQSNSVWINGRDLRDILGEKKGLRKESRCHGCSKLMRTPCECRTYAYRGKRYSCITQGMVREGVMKMMGAKARKRPAR